MLVIKATRGIGYVGGVQASAHADFQHDELRSRMGKVLECRGGQELKKAWGLLQFLPADQALDGCGDLGECGRKIRVRNLPAVHAHALIDAHQMG